MLKILDEPGEYYLNEKYTTTTVGRLCLKMEQRQYPNTMQNELSSNYTAI